MASFFSAKNAKVRSGGGGSTVTCKKWTVKNSADMIDVSNFEGAGFKDVIAGLKECNITIEMHWDGAVNPFDTPIWIPGTAVSTLKLYLNDTTGPYWLFPSVMCESVDNPADVKDAMQLTYTFKTKGTFTLPTGTTS